MPSAPTPEDRTVCPDCGRPLDGTKPEVCPNCLLSLGLTLSGTDIASDEGEDANYSLKESAGLRIGRYQLVEVIGQGGFGTVWMAEQQEPVRRRVALKILKLGMDTNEVVARFEAERQALALMDHPNIARVYDGGATDTGRPYFVMELVRGVSVTEFCDERQWNTRQRIELFIDVCSAVQHAHQKGIIHRDLKPSNLLVTEQDGKAIPKVVDFGIAKATDSRLTDKRLVTRFNQFVGTPSYMSPEQAGLGGLDVDSRSDIYSLGVLLYELLTGTVPLNLRKEIRAGYEAVLSAIRDTDPLKPSTQLSTLSHEELNRVAARRNEPPGQLNRAFRSELDWLVLKALEKDRNRRYQTANALGADLRNYLAGEPISAAPPSVTYQLRKFARKHRVVLASAASLTLVLIAGVIATSWQALRATRLRVAAEKMRDEQRTSLYASEMAVAFRSWELGQASRTRKILGQQIPAPGQKDLRGWEWRYLWRQAQPLEKAIYPDQPGYVTAVAGSPNGSRLAVGAGGQGNVRVWDAQERKILVERDIGSGVIDSLEFTPDGQGLYVTLRTADFLMLNAATLEKNATFTGHTQQVCAVTAHPDGRTVVSAAGELFGQVGMAEMFAWDVARQAIVFKFPPRTELAFRPRFSPHGRYLARPLSSTGLVEVWDTQDWRKLAEFNSHHGLVRMAVFSPDELTLATCGGDGFVRLWDWRTHEELATFGPHAGAAEQVQFSSDGQTLLSSGADSMIRLWDVSTRQERITFRGHNGRVQAIFSPDGRFIISGGGADQTVRFWDAGARKIETLLDRDLQTIAWSQFVPKRNEFCLLRMSETGSLLKVWKNSDSSSLSMPMQIRSASTREKILFTAVGTELALVVALDHEVSIQDPVTGRERLRLQSPAPLIGTFGTSRDGRWLAAIGAPDAIVIWDMASGRTSAFRLPAGIGLSPAAGSGAIQFSADGNRLWVAHPNWVDILVIDWKAADTFTRWPGHSRGINALALTGDGNWLASGSTDLTARLWDAKTGQPKGVLAAENGGAISLAFSPDDRTLAVGCFDGQLKLWNVVAGAEIATLHSHASILYSLAFSADGRTLVSTSYDGTTRIWQAPTLAQIGASP